MLCPGGKPGQGRGSTSNNNRMFPGQETEQLRNDRAKGWDAIESNAYPMSLGMDQLRVVLSSTSLDF